MTFPIWFRTNLVQIDLFPYKIATISTYFYCSFDTNYTIKPGEVWRLQNWLPHLYYPISHGFLTIPTSIISEIFQENPNKLKSIQIDRLQLIFLLNPSFKPWLNISCSWISCFPSHLTVPSYSNLFSSHLIIMCYSIHSII